MGFVGINLQGSLSTCWLLGLCSCSTHHIDTRRYIYVEKQFNKQKEAPKIYYYKLPLAGVVTELVSEHKLFLHVKVKLNKKCFSWHWLVGIVCFNCYVIVETCVANEIQTCGHKNYSRYMYLFIDLWNAYYQYIIVFPSVSSFFSELCVGVKILRKCVDEHLLKAL